MNSMAKTSVLLTQLCEWRACKKGIEWFSASGFQSFAEAWEACPRSDWMLWFLRKAGYSDMERLREYAAWCVQSTPDSWKQARVAALSADAAAFDAAAIAAAEDAFAAFADDKADTKAAAVAAYAATRLAQANQLRTMISLDEIPGETR